MASFKLTQVLSASNGLLCLLVTMATLSDVMAKSDNNMTFGPPSDEKLTWWKTGVVYQVYPRSFKDTNGDGIGDLQGVVDELDYLKSLGIKAIWLSPFFKSPMADMGYDISDYISVDPLFGDNAVFDELIKGIHSRGMKMIIDFVPGHTSTEHEWFQKSIKKQDPYTDYYIWHDGKVLANSTRVPPNNWLSVFGGSAWDWNKERGQYYYHAFHKSQGNINFRNDKVKEEMKGVLRFWFNKGVDGVRVDAISHIFTVANVSLDAPSAGNNLSDFNYNSQSHIYQEDRPEILPVVNSWVKLLEEYEKKDGESRYMILETYAGVDVRTRYFSTGANPFNFELTWANKPITGFEIRTKVLHEYVSLPPGKWPNFVLGNHDVRRVSEKFGSDHVDVFNMLLLTLWGTPTTYYGEEIGMVPPTITWNQTVDPWGINYGPDHYKEFSRDYSRSPMQWDNSSFAGFTTGNATWLPVASAYTYINVKEEQDKEGMSTLTMYKVLAALRHNQAFRRGKITIGVTTQNVFSFVRGDGQTNRFLVALNVGETNETNNFSANAGASSGIVAAFTPNTPKVVNTFLRTSLSQLTLNPGEGVVIWLIPDQVPDVDDSDKTRTPTPDSSPCGASTLEVDSTWFSIQFYLQLFCCILPQRVLSTSSCRPFMLLLGGLFIFCFLSYRP